MNPSRASGEPVVRLPGRTPAPLDVRRERSSGDGTFLGDDNGLLADNKPILGVPEPDVAVDRRMGLVKPVSIMLAVTWLKLPAIFRNASSICVLVNGVRTGSIDADAGTAMDESPSSGAVIEVECPAEGLDKLDDVLGKCVRLA